MLFIYSCVALLNSDYNLLHRNVYKLAVIVLVQFSAYSIVLLVYTCTVHAK